MNEGLAATGFSEEGINALWISLTEECRYTLGQECSRDLPGIWAAIGEGTGTFWNLLTEERCCTMCRNGRGI